MMTGAGVDAFLIKMRIVTPLGLRFIETFAFLQSPDRSCPSENEIFNTRTPPLSRLSCCAHSPISPSTSISIHR